jgi:hypothetical protein
MKNIILLFSTLICFASCDPICNRNVTFTNNTIYDLQIFSFKKNITDTTIFFTPIDTFKVKANALLNVPISAKHLGRCSASFSNLIFESTDSIFVFIENDSSLHFIGNLKDSANWKFSDIKMTTMRQNCTITPSMIQ